jgi:DNA-binding response OmpR family regulator
MLSRRLERRGYEVILAMDGRLGLAAARSESPDLILMDMSLRKSTAGKSRADSSRTTRRGPSR